MIVLVLDIMSDGQTISPIGESGIPGADRVENVGLSVEGQISRGASRRYSSRRADDGNDDGEKR